MRWLLHTVKHHNSYRSMDCTSALFKKVFPDSETAWKISSACIKTEAIVSPVLASYSVDITLKAIEEILYCGVSTDRSSHGAVKIFPLLVQYFDWKSGGVQSKWTELKNTPNESADNIAQYIKETLEENALCLQGSYRGWLPSTHLEELCSLRGRHSRCWENISILSHLHCAHREFEGALWICWYWIQKSPFSQQDTMAVTIPRYWEAATDVSRLESILFVTGEKYPPWSRSFLKVSSVRFTSGTCTLSHVYSSHTFKKWKQRATQLWKWRKFWTGSTSCFSNAKLTTSCHLKWRGYWHKSNWFQYSSAGSVQFMLGVSGEVDGTHGGVLLFCVDGSEWATCLEQCRSLY